MQSRFLILAAVLTASGGWAQNYVVQSVSLPYVALTGATSLVGTTGFSSTADDEEVIVPIGFAFPYYGSTYNSLLVSSNGFVSFTTTNVCGIGTGFSGCNDGQSIPRATRTTGSPHLVIAPWWDDHQLVSGTSDISYKSSASQFDLEFKNVNAYSFSGFTYAFTWKLTLQASGAIQIHYGPHSGSGGTAVVGWEDATATVAPTNGDSLPLPPAATKCSLATASCTMSNYPSDTLYTIGQPVQPDLVVQTVNLGSVTRNGGNLSITVNPTFRNFGQNAGNSFRWRAYLSTDQTFQMANDIFVVNSASTLNCAGGSTVSDTASATIATPPVGNYYVLVQVDYLDAVVEGTFGESNNWGSTVNYFVQGLDLVATGISGPANSGPGNMMTVHVNYFNQGTDPVPGSGLMPYRVYLSTDNMWSANDFQLYPATGDATKMIAGGQTVDEDVTFTVPMNVPGGDFFYVIKLDPDNTIVEGSDTNNTAVSGNKVNVRQADLVIKSVEFVDVATGVPTRRALFGSQGRMLITAANEGGADARNFKVGVVISVDTNLSLLSDTLVIESPVTAVLQGTTQVIDVTFNIPLNNKNNQPFAAGNYFFFGMLDSQGMLTELNEFNNNMVVMNPVLCNPPAPDLTVVRFDAPPNVGVGEIAPVYRVFKNIGNQDAPEVKYRYYVSANPQITVDDTPMQIINGSTMTDFGAVTLAQGQVNVATEFVQLPSGLTPGTYYLGAVIDSAAQVSELDELNNGLGSTPVQVAPSSLRVSTSSLPDAVTGRPYSFQLSVSGDVPGMPTTWAVDTAQGPLPMGMMLSAGGLLTGTPTTEQVIGVTFTATNNGRTAVARLALRVLPTTTQVEITTPSLPSVVNNPTLSYETYMGAAGGVKPYAWSQVPVTGEVMPAGLTLTADGKLSGFPRAGLFEKPYPLTIEVRDSLGTTSRRQFNLRVVAPGAILFTNLAIPDGLVGVNYLTDISVKNADMTALSKPLTWRLVQGSLPDGLTLATEQDVELIQGTPLVSGTFAFTLEVEDSKGRNDSADFLLRVYPPGLKVGVNSLPNILRPGDPVDFNFVVGGSNVVTFSIFSGALPPGVHFGPDGHVTGNVEMQMAEGTYNFVVEARDGTGATGLAAFTLFVKRDTTLRQGCSAAPATAGLWLLFGLVPLLFRRRRGLAGLAAVLALSVPLTARAQDYLLLGPTPVSYSTLTAATTVSSGATVPIPFPFQFYGMPVASMEMSAYGYLTTSSDDTDSSNTGIPHNSSSAPTNFIAPWWDSLYGGLTGQGGLLRYQNFGVSPGRYIVFEWSNMAASSTTTGMRTSFEVILYEGTNEIRFAYSATAPGTGSASVGIQKQLNTGIAGLGCTTSTSGACSGASMQYPSGSMIQFQLPPDLSIKSLSMDQVGYAGVTFHANALVFNGGGKDVTANFVRYYLSADAVYQAGTDTQIGDSFPLRNFVANTDTLVGSSAAIPMGTAPGMYYVLSQVDPNNDASESNEMNNFGPPMQITVGPPTPDLITQGVTAPAMSAPGAMVNVARTFTNVGNASAGAFKYTWFISDNSVVSISDQPLGAAIQVSDLVAMMSDSRTDMVMLPAGLPAGLYWLGACVNYDPQGTPQFGIQEISQVNNCSQAPMPTVVSSGALSIVTAMQLPPATQYSPYGMRLKAVGGNGSYLWALTPGSVLPPGLQFTAQGDLQGTPATTGTFSFEVAVSSGGTEVKQQMSLMVAPGNIPLAIVDQDLPAAEFGRAYASTIVGVGGKPPYIWHLKMDARLPAGLALSPEGGIEGRANESGDFSFGVEVTDSAMTKAAKDLRVRVVNPTTMHIATSRLKTALLKQDYTQQLQAVGGKAPYTWTLLKFQQLPQNPTEAPGMPGTDFPTDFGIHIEDGNLDYLRGEPKKAGLYAVTFRVTDANSAEDFTTLPLIVSYNEPIAITTTALPDAFVGHDYAAKLSHNRGKESTGIVFSLPCVQQAVTADTFMCAPVEPTQKLPTGLTITQDGTISGTPTDANEADKVFSFFVKVVDDAGRQDVRSLSVRMRQNIASGGSGGGGGCSSAMGLMPALALLGLALRRKTGKKARP